MINVQKFIEELKKNKLSFSTGVPDSLFKDLCYGFQKNYKKKILLQQMKDLLLQ